MTTVDDAVPALSKEQIQGLLIGYLQNARLPTTDWLSGAFIRTLMQFHGTAPLQNFGLLKARIVKNGFPIEATGDDLTNLAQQIFSITRNISLAGPRFAQTFTQQAVVLSCDASHGPYSVTSGSFSVRSRITGNRYTSITSGTIPSNGSVTVTFQAESANDSANGLNFADGPGTLTNVSENPLPGVTANNVAPNFSAVTAVAVGLGVVTVGGTPAAAPTAYDVQITTAGQVGVAVFEYRTNGGLWNTGHATATNFTIPSGPTIHFANDGGGSNPSFLVGDKYSFTSPGTPITQQGLDPETDSALLARCQARWPSLDAEGDTTDKHQVWALAASPLVTRVKVALDTNYPGRVLVTIAGVTNPLGSPTVAAVQLYIDQREEVGDLSLVAAATVTTVTATGTVTVPILQLATVQAAAKASWDPYVAGTAVAGTIRLAVLEAFLMDAGAIDVSGLQLNGSPTNLVIAANAIGSPADITSTLTWVGV
ncbi:MAG: hypothetical protein EPN98_21530 [Phenylobacterium sp.]|uniref:hypothetical protein n=1 Tax=Phenylobacterium sp. TaxID=1871053 RepID=UPI0012209A90|nr:hypothetical protein [Phenylobacterium sp.]TAL29026.1 MAG: hypothetical protein EPN98_21530 [Phenylobacterium sp.]